MKNTTKKAIVTTILVVVFVAIVAGLGYLAYVTSPVFVPEEEEELVVEETPLWEVEGYESEEAYNTALNEKKAQYTGAAEIKIAEYAGYITDEQAIQLRDMEVLIVACERMSEITVYEARWNEVIAAVDAAKVAAEQAAAEQAAQQVSYDYNAYDYSGYTNTSGLTPQSGVNYYNGRTETYYSSNVLYHYNTPNWVLGSDGVYRTQDGYVVVAASDLPYGSYVETSFGTGQVLDTGCAAGVTDIYTSW